MTGPGPVGEGRPVDGRGREGFVLGFVVLFLFTIAMAATAGYQIVSAEFAMAQSSRDGEKALVVARAGLERFLGEQVGSIADSVEYAIGDGVVTVTTRKVLEQDSLNHLYYVRAEGEVADVRLAADPASRVVSTYAWHRMSPIPHVGAVVMTEGSLSVRSSYFGGAAAVNGADLATADTCAAGGTAGVPGVATSGAASTAGSGTILGNPATVTSYVDFADVYDTLDIRWDILTDPDFPFEYQDALPNYATLPADSFPLVRFTGDQTAHFWQGRGVLVVTGTLTPGWNFYWEGIVLAGQLGTVSWYSPTIRGMLVGGLNDAQGSTQLQSGDYRYHSCNVYDANRALSYLERLDNAVFETS